MRAVAPRLGLHEVTLAEDQQEYIPITVGVARFADGSTSVTSRWRLTDEEKQRIANGEDVYVTLLTFGGPMQPISISIGRPDWTKEAP